MPAHSSSQADTRARQDQGTCPRLVEFSGDQAEPSDAGQPHVSGRVLIYYLSELESKTNHFDFAQMDREIRPWVDAGKFVILPFSTAGWRRWKEPWSQQGAPAWAMKKYAIGSVTEIDGAVLPVYWSSGYLVGLGRFLHVVVAHLQASPYHDRIAFIEVGVGDGGETKPDTEQNKTTKQCAARLALMLQDNGFDSPAAISSASLWWKPLPSELAWQVAPMSHEGSAWKAEVPVDPRGLMYLVDLRATNGAAGNFPDERRETPWHIDSPQPGRSPARLVGSSPSANAKHNVSH